MINKAIINTENAPAAIGTYSQAIKVNNTVYLSGQIPLDPESMELVVNTIMASHFEEPYPARAAIGISQLPKEAEVEMDAIMVI